jgi:hypothetical protein
MELRRLVKKMLPGDREELKAEILKLFVEAEAQDEVIEVGDVVKSSGNLKVEYTVIAIRNGQVVLDTGKMVYLENLADLRLTLIRKGPKKYEVMAESFGNGVVRWEGACILPKGDYKAVFEEKSQ